MEGGTIMMVSESAKEILWISKEMQEKGIDVLKVLRRELKDKEKVKKKKGVKRK